MARSHRRLGYTWGPALLCSRAATWRDNSNLSQLLPAPRALHDQRQSNGYTVGAGLEYMFAPNWSASRIPVLFGNTTFNRPLLTSVLLCDDEHTSVGVLPLRLGGAGAARSRRVPY